MQLVERLNVTANLDPYMGLKALDAYSGLSVRKLRQLIDHDPADALPVYRVDGRVLVRRRRVRRVHEPIPNQRPTFRNALRRP